MRVIIDRGIPFLEGVIEPYAQVLYLSPEEITPAVVKDVDAMFVRTRTRINKELLHGSKVRFVATATIGFDHIDQDYCREASIRWVSCPYTCSRRRATGEYQSKSKVFLCCLLQK